MSAPAGAVGFEYPDNGAVAEGRGGAFVARASDPTALIHNTAGIMGLPGVQIALGTNVSFWSNCFARAGNYPSDADSTVINDGTVFANSNYTNGTTRYPRVCNDGGVGVTPHLALTWRINRFTGIGLALYGPNTSGATQTFPDRVMTDSGLAPSPVRYMLYERGGLVIFPTLAAAFAPTGWFRFGASIAPSYFGIRLVTMVNTIPAAAQSPSGDIRTTLSPEGIFFAGNLGLQLLPTPWLSFGASLHYNSTAHLSGTADTLANPYAPPGTAPIAGHFHIDRMTITEPWTVRAGARFNLPRAGHPVQNELHEDRARVYDPMRDDVFDLEADFYYEHTSSMSLTVLENSGVINVGTTSVPAPPHAEVLADFTDVVGVRIGGDVNIVPGVFAVRAGVAWDTPGMSNTLAQLHIPAYQNTSIHLGATLRLAWFSVHLAAAHYFLGAFDADMGMRTVTSTGMVTTDLCARSAGDGACSVNRGVYQGDLTILSVGLGASF
jgi:long-chain fatty acid transport protein